MLRKVSLPQGFLLILTFLAIAWLFWRDPLGVPPGLEMDELIEAEIAERVLVGEWQPFYPEGQGREGLYHYWLAGWLAALGPGVFALRMASTTLTLLGLAAWAAFFRRLFGPSVAWLALALAGSSFWVLFAARSGLRSTALMPAAGFAALAFWQALRQNRSRHWLAAGALSGLGLYAYTAGRVLPGALVMFALYVLARRPTTHRCTGRGGAMAVASFIVVAAPLLLFLRAHPEADQFDFLDFNRPLAALEAGDPVPAARTALATLGMFTIAGDPLIFDNIPDRPVFGPLVGVLFYAGILVALWRWRKPAFGFVLLWLVVGLVPGMLSQPAPNYYRTVLAQPVTFVFPALAVTAVAGQVARRAGARSGALLTAGAGAFLIALQLPATARAYFNAWPAVEGVAFFWQAELAAQAKLLEEVPADADVVLCTVLTYEADPWWRPAYRSMPYLIRRSDLRLRYHDCRTTRLTPAGGEALVLVPAELTDEQLDVAAWQAAAPIRVASWAPEVGGAALDLPVTFGDSLRLTGYTLRMEESGQFLQLLTRWEVLKTPPPRLALFTHVMSDPQTVLTQQDQLPVTTQSLLPGDRLLVLHDRIPVPISGQELFPVAVGLYSQDSGERLPLPLGDRLFLAPFVPPGD